MATLSSPPTPGSLWRLEHSLDAYSQHRGAGLATQLLAGRHLRVLREAPESAGEGARPRLRVRLLEDGYPCWLDPLALRRHGHPAAPPRLPLLNRSCIVSRIESVLHFAEQARLCHNRYLWGGTLGPDFDCSGLIQTAYAQAGIWLPRDAYLQERFCRPVAVQPGQTSLLAPGDLIFFGPSVRCSHVGLHLQGGRYLHSSGQEHGRDGIGIDDLHPHNTDPVAMHYRGELRGAGRVMRCHDGSPLPP